MRAGRLPQKLAATSFVLLAAHTAAADEGGVSFWLLGQFGSFAAAPGDPGWSLQIVYYHTSTDASASRSFQRGGSIVAGLDVRADLAIVIPTYAFSTSVAGGQASLGMAVIVGRPNVGTSGTLTGPASTTLTGGQSDTQNGFGDLYPSASLKWNLGNHTFMVYSMGGVPE